MKVGFVGLGVMGKAMAGHLLDRGYDLYVYNRTLSKADELVNRGATLCHSPKELAQLTDVVITIVGYPEDVRKVYQGEDGLFKGSRPNQIYVDMTTSTPTLAEELAQVGQELGVSVIDAPVSGGDKGAREGILTAMVGGKEEDLERVREMLETFCANIVYHGLHGKGQHAKAANQIMVAATMIGTAEVFAYTQETGLDIEKVIETLGGGAASNWSLLNYGPRIIQQDYSPGFFVKHFVKDLGIVLEEAEARDLKLPGTELASKLYQSLVNQGFEDDGTQAIVKLWFEA